MTILDKIVERKLKQYSPEIDTAESARPLPIRGNAFLSALLGATTKIIGEVKPKSPSAGSLLDAGRLDIILSAYRKHCVAVSVLTDDLDFGGSFELLKYVKKTTALPVLCKDFIVSKRQISLARDAGADAVLLIVKILDQSQLQSLVQEAYKAGLAPVVEIGTIAEAESIRDLPIEIVLINNRNLTTMEIDLNTTARLATYVKGNQSLISASGINTGECINGILPYANTFLIGSSLMKCDDPSIFLTQIKTQLVGSNR
ncbi:MAG: indole-3-glycerol phosphate synthase TrpC [Candidatus Obscuribacterales bacterium]|nr:indole-3-glycerol phosphate synthase TrpC [Candidatus Obscuribacterales bacterium]